MGGNGSGAHTKEVDVSAMLDLIERGATVPEMTTVLGVSAPTLRRRIADLQEKQGLLLQYKAIQNLQLTELQARCLEAITPEKIESASMYELIRSFKILKDAELEVRDNTKMSGLVGYLLELEKQNFAIRGVDPAASANSNVEDAEFSDLPPLLDPGEDLPDL